MDTQPGGPRFILSLFRVNPAYLREMIGTGSSLDRLVEAIDKTSGAPRVRGYERVRPATENWRGTVTTRELQNEPNLLNDVRFRGFDDSDVV